ncbi:MAG: hypothetical protein HDR56_02485 [Treponema sp.]|nr:hypothetical protein [Treponema sp.]
MGENPIKETIKLKYSGDYYKDYYLELKADGTVLQIYFDSKSEVEKTVCKYKYAYDDEKKTITMKLEKTDYHNEIFFSEAEGQLLTYSEFCSKIAEEYTVENIRQSEKEYYEKNKDDRYFKEDYPDCDAYEDYEAIFVKRKGFRSLDDFLRWYMQLVKDSHKAQFSAKITYAYKIEGGKMTLTEKFTGVKNMVQSECMIKSNNSSISAAYATIEEADASYGGTPNTDKKTINFESRKIGEEITVPYVEDIDAGTVTINFKGKEYVYEFKGYKYIQVE